MILVCSLVEQPTTGNEGREIEEKTYDRRLKSPTRKMLLVKLATNRVLDAQMLKRNEKMIETSMS